LSLRVWQAGGNVAICPDAWFESISQVDEVHKANLNRNYERDSELFFGRWEPVYGKRVNYAKSVPEHVAYSRTKIKALPFKTPPEISWVLRSLFQAKQWENMRTLITNPDPELAMSRMGLSVFEAKLVRNATKVPSDLFDELLDWLITIENEFQAEAEVSE
jgi:hypothetical protein